MTGNSSRTSTRDLIGDIAKGLRGAGIRFMLYYQTGPDGNPDFWNAQQFPSASFTDTGTDGPFKGLLQHGMFRMEQDWAVAAPNMPIITKITSAQAISFVKSARQRNVPLSINLTMWNGGVCAPTSLEVLSALKKHTRK